MVANEDEAMWCVVMFDLPTLKKSERRDANRFRNLLLDLGFWRTQFSVYSRFTPTAGGSTVAVKSIKRGLPPGGDVRILYVTDKQWAKTLRFSNAHSEDSAEQPTQLTIF